MSERAFGNSPAATPGYLTADLPGIGGRIKVEFEDFQVEEIPLYAPSGAGEHTFFEIEKRGVPTFRAIHEIARALHIAPQTIGYAGLKDAHAVTRQVLSAERVEPDALLALQLPSIRILWAKRHTNKLKPGHLAGNRFVIRIREVPPEALEPARAILSVLQRRGVPNSFGSQRFGRRGDTHALGRAIVADDGVGFCRLFLGAPLPSETAQIQEARRLYDAGDLPAALAAWPRQFSDERAALEILLRKKERPDRYQQTMHSVSKRLRIFFVSAYQSELFNRVMAARLQTLDRLFAGDVATKHDSGGSFIVTDPAVEQPRADRFEISPSGPLYGYRSLLAEGEPGRLERQILADEGLTLEQFKTLEALRIKGGRRPLRFPLREVESWYDAGVVLKFTLPAGCYATNVLAEITKSASLRVEEEREAAG